MKCWCIISKGDFITHGVFTTKKAAEKAMDELERYAFFIKEMNLNTLWEI